MNHDPMIKAPDGTGLFTRAGGRVSLHAAEPTAVRTASPAAKPSLTADTDLILVKILRRLPYHNRACEKDEVIQMTYGEAVIFQSYGFVEIGSITIDQRVVNNTITRSSVA